MPEMKSVPQAEWRGLFDRMSKTLLGKRAEIEVASLDLGDQIVAEWVPLVGLAYDSRDDRLDVVLERTNHAILHPSEIIVDEQPAGFASVAVVDKEGARHVVRFRNPLMLLPA